MKFDDAVVREASFRKLRALGTDGRAIDQITLAKPAEQPVSPAAELPSCRT